MGTAALLSPRLDAPVPPGIRTTPRQQDAAPTRRRANKTPRQQDAAPARRRASKTLRHSYTRDLPDTQREIIQARIPPQRSGGDRRLPD